MLIKIIKKVPDSIFNLAKKEIDNINFDDYRDPRSNADVFKTSKAIHIRIHKPPENLPQPNSINDWCKIVECVNNINTFEKFPKIIKLSNWILKEVNGLSIGRIMIVNLSPRGTVDVHIDPLDYFEKFSRFHIPFKTNLNVLFKNNLGNKAHMPYKTLCRLNNRELHGLENNSDEDRIHLIVDIELKEKNSPF